MYACVVSASVPAGCTKNHDIDRSIYMDINLSMNLHSNRTRNAPINLIRLLLILRAQNW